MKDFGKKQHNCH